MSDLKSKQIRILFLILFVFALTIRMIYFLEFRENPYFEYIHPSHDSINVHNAATEICKGNILLKGSGFKYPFYSYFVAAIYSLTERTIYAVWLFQFILGALGAALLFLIGTKLFNRMVGIIASLFYALYGPNLFYEGIMLRAALTEFLVLLSFWLLLRFETKISLRNVILSGISLSFMVQCRPNTVVLLPLVLLYVYLRTLKMQSVKKRLMYSFTLIVTIIVIGTPLLLRAIYTERRFQFYDPAGPSVFLMGNLVDYDGLGWHGGSPRYQGYLEGYKDQVNHDYHWVLTKVLKDILDHPSAFVRLYLRKLFFFFCNLEIPSNNNFYIHQNFSYLLMNPINSFSLVISLAFMGFLSTIKTYRKYILLYIFLLGMTSAVVLFYNVSRFRMPVLPFYLLLASVGIYSFYQLIVGRRIVKLLIAIIVVIGLLLLLKTPGFIQKVRSVDYGMLGDAYLANGRYDECIFEYKKSINLNPNYYVSESVFLFLVEVEASFRG